MTYHCREIPVEDEVALIAAAPLAPVPIPDLTEEQQLFADACRPPSAFRCSAIPGSGKTTSIILSARVHPDLRFLILTYNALLKDDGRQKCVAWGVENCEIHSFHSFAAKYCAADFSAGYDIAIRNFLKSNPQLGELMFDVLIVDEAQDMTSLYYNLVRHAMTRMPAIGTFGIVGDPMQTLYHFRFDNPARADYLLDPARFFEVPYPWTNLTLSLSFRLTPAMAAFANQVIVPLGPPGSPHIQTVDRPCEPVRFLSNTSWKTSYLAIYADIKTILETHPPDDIAVLCHSGLNSSRPTEMTQLANYLGSHKIPTVSLSDRSSRKGRDLLIRGKVIFAHFPSFKGGERKFVFMLGFGCYIHEHLCMLGTPEAPNSIYVGLTRASVRLTVVHTGNDGFPLQIPRDQLRTMTIQQPEVLELHEGSRKQWDQMDKHGTNIYCHRDCRCMNHCQGPNHLPILASVTDILHQFSETSSHDIVSDEIYGWRELPETKSAPCALLKATKLRDTMILLSNGLYEDVSAIRGTCVTSLFISRLDKSIMHLMTEANQWYKELLKKLSVDQANDIINPVSENINKLKRMTDGVNRDNWLHSPEFSDDIVGLTMLLTHTVRNKSLEQLLALQEVPVTDWFDRAGIKALFDQVGYQVRWQLPAETRASFDFKYERSHKCLTPIMLRTPHCDHLVPHLVAGAIDLALESEDKIIIVEIKTTTSIEIGHKLQALLYAALHPGRTVEAWVCNPLQRTTARFVLNDSQEWKFPLLDHTVRAKFENVALCDLMNSLRRSSSDESSEESD